MNIGISTFGGDGGKSGISRYIIKLIEGLSDLSENDTYKVIAFDSERKIFVPNGHGNVEPIGMTEGLRSPIRNILWHQTSLSGVVKKNKLDVLFLPAANRRVPMGSPCPTVGTVHDFSSLYVDGKYDPARMFYIKKVLPWLIRKLDHVLTVSESSKRDIVEYAHVPAEKVKVTYLAADSNVYYPGEQDQSRRTILEKYPVSKNYILYISRLEHPGKNHVRLIDAFNKLRSDNSELDLQLVLAGSKWPGCEAIHQAAKASPFSEDVIFPGFVTEEDLAHLYRGADLFVFPSLYEGFGLPVLEALSCGTPVACSNISSIPEVAGNAALYFDPKNLESIADSMRKLLTEVETKERLITEGLNHVKKFTWERTAKDTYEILKQTALLNGKRR